MKRIANLSVYKLLGYLLVGIGAYAVFNANNTNLQATAPVTQQQTPYKQKREKLKREEFAPWQNRQKIKLTD